MASAASGGGPSVRQRQVAKQEGHVAVSRELVFAVSFSIVAVALWWRAPMVLHSFRVFLIAQFASAASPENAMLIEEVHKSMLVIVQAVSPLLLVLCGTVFLGHWIQHGPIWTPTKLALDFGRLNPQQGWHRLFRWASFGTLSIGLLKLGILSAAVVWAISHNAADIAALPYVPADQLLAFSSELFLRVAAACALGLAAVAAIDFTWQNWRYEIELHARFDESQDEVKAVQNDVSVMRRNPSYAPPAAQQDENDASKER